jgi:hypothetical protein
MTVNSSLMVSACERGRWLQFANESTACKRSGVGAVLDQQSKNDREQDEEEKPSFHGRECDTRFRQVNSGSPVGLFLRNATLRPQGATGAFEADRIHFVQ